MKPILVLSLACLTLSCGRDTDTVVGPKPPPPEGYPFVLTFTQERYTRFVADWQRFSGAYNLPPALPSFDSVLMMPVLPPVDLMPGDPDTVTIDGARTLLFSFMERWRQFFLTDGPWYAWQEYDQPGDRRYRFILARTPAPEFPGTPFNRVQAWISHDGVLMEFSSTCLPQVPVTAQIRYSLEEVVQIVDGTVLHFFDWGGPDSVVVTPERIEEAVLEVTYIPVRSPAEGFRYQRIEYRRCWRLRVPVYYIYVDAITGEFLDYSQQYIIF